MKTAFQHIKEFVFQIVLVPVKLTLDHAKANDAVVDPAQDLVGPGLHLPHQSADIHQFEKTEFDVALDLVVCHATPPYHAFAGDGAMN
jgi:hypothetical protein